MKNALLSLLIGLCCLSLPAGGQTILPNLRFGKPTPEEMSMTKYAPDGNADGKMLCRYTLTQRDNQVSIRYIFRLNKLLFLPTDYHELQQFWEVMAKKNNEMMVLKKL